MEHGTNPGLVSHLTKQALTDVATTMLAEPTRAFRTPERDEVLAAANPYLGERPSVATGWTPHNTGTDSLTVSHDDAHTTDPWQFSSVLAS